MATRQDRLPRPDDSKSAGGSEAAEPPACLPNVACAGVAEMRSYKHRIHSVLLHRMAHADIFEVGAAAPTLLFILFGGSGVDEEEYERRSHTVIPIFGPVLERLSHGAVNTVMAYVSAPYDVPFNRFASDPSSAGTWNAHVLTELLKPWSKLPYFVSGFSGGAALALNGLHKDPRCFGGGRTRGRCHPP